MGEQDWLEESRARIDSFADLEPGWYEGTGERISPRSMKRAKHALPLFAERPGIFPRPEGHVAFEWLTEDSHYEVEFCGDDADKMDEFWSYCMNDEDI